MKGKTKTGNKQSRSSYTLEKGQQACELVAGGLSEIRAARELGVSMPTLYRWQERFPAFGEAMERAREMRLKVLEAGAHESLNMLDDMARSPEYTDTQVRAATNGFKAKIELLRVYVPKFKEKQAVEVTGANGRDLLPALDPETMKAAIAASQASFSRIARQIEDEDSQ